MSATEHDPSIANLIRDDFDDNGLNAISQTSIRCYIMVYHEENGRRDSVGVHDYPIAQDVEVIGVDLGHYPRVCCIDVTLQYADMLTAAGLVGVMVKTFKWLSSVWPREKKYKEIGRWNFVNIDGGLEGLSMLLFTRALGLSVEETMGLCEGAMREIGDVGVYDYLLDCYVARLIELSHVVIL
ncbi:hypothetical protein B0T17DRAFT_511059 [Bombardia bombarda]|uniref:Uncharacterized protein n=1 Tax=Bombardia bombarda TaxID=252184 RepID=A0AA39WH36_9PEZI|nr:hypothetical protein B0T17DRAFT_511059 [Bombardia bombarda]